jgi:hypothetical protein
MTGAPLTVPTRFACYLAETRWEDDRPSLRTLDAGQLCELLSCNVKDFHYSGCGLDVVGLYRYDSGGTLTPLAMHHTGSYRDGEDWLYWEYEVCAADRLTSDGGHAVEVTFTVCIDGRA